MVHDLRWENYTKEKEDFIKRDFFVAVLHPKGGVIVCTCVEDNILG